MHKSTRKLVNIVLASGLALLPGCSKIKDYFECKDWTMEIMETLDQHKHGHVYTIHLENEPFSPELVGCIKNHGKANGYSFIEHAEGYYSAEKL